ncbi:2-oxoacid:acceptor oxidoreductase family protein [Bacilliculturomica massiliensis]|uniref:2-oxoacid:acceptor oxidoreductase family protein n=1 Tax=Bacilliculturomica massiliensis TaxID=1917867 RepID=UPI0010317CF1|nr:2-oxoacid:acceptor oxidoreductase family protein [Bacilliculturomica massiliensis]
MIEIRWHGRGGQGAFTAARLLGNAVVFDGKNALAFPSFGPERRGAPVLAFTRIDSEKINDRSDVVECDCAVVLDETLLGAPVKAGLKPGAKVIINTTKSPEAFDFSDCPGCQVITVDATGLALKILGRPITNVPMLGALTAVADVTSLDSIYKAIDSQLAEKIRAKNKALLDETYKTVKEAL